MKSLSKTEQTQLNVHAAALLAMAEALDAERGLITEAIEEFNLKVATYNEALQEARTWVEDIVSVMNDYAGDRSEKWRESEAGEAYASWIEEYENIDLDDLEEMSLPDFTSPTHGADLEALSSQPNN